MDVGRSSRGGCLFVCLFFPQHPCRFLVLYCEFLGKNGNTSQSIPFSFTFLGQRKHPIALWTLPSDFIGFVSPGFPCLSSFLYIFVPVLYFCYQPEQQTGFYCPVSPTQGSRSGQHPAHHVPSCVTESPAPQWDSLSKEIKFPLGPPSPSDFCFGLWLWAVGPSRCCHPRVQQNPPGSCCHPQLIPCTHRGIMVVFNCGRFFYQQISHLRGPLWVFVSS